MKKKIVSKKKPSIVNIALEPGELYQINLVSGLGVTVPPPQRRGKPPITLDLTNKSIIAASESKPKPVKKPAAKPVKAPVKKKK